MNDHPKGRKPAHTRITMDRDGSAEVLVNGEPLRYVTNLKVSMAVDDLPQVTATVLALGDVDIELPDAVVRVEVDDPTAQDES